MKPSQSRPSPIGGHTEGLSPEAQRAIEQLSSEIGSLRSQLAQAISETTALRERANSLEQSARTAQKDITTAEASIDGDKSQLTRLFKKMAVMQRDLNPLHTYAVLNSEAEEIPAYSVCEITGKNADTEVYTVRKPTADSLSPGILLFTGGAAIPAYTEGGGETAPAGRGVAFSPFDKPITVNIDTAPTVGAQAGTVNGSWSLKLGNSGLVAMDIGNPCKVRAAGDASGSIGLATMGGLVVAYNAGLCTASATITTMAGAVLTAQTVVIFGAPQTAGFTMPAGVYLMAARDTTGTWIVEWPFSMTNHDAGAVQLYGHNAGAMQWFTNGPFTCPE